jgi:Predicted membrane protein (DUF2142)
VQSFQEVPAGSSAGTTESPSPGLRNQRRKGTHTRTSNPRFAKPRSFLGTWTRCFLVLFALCVAWALATPLTAAPDEPAQIVKAAATVRGEFTGKPTPAQPGAVREFRVPAVFNSIYNLPICYQFHPKVPAGCAPHVPSSGRTVTSTSYVGRYPPLYYAIVGLPTLVMHSESVVYFMRILSALIDALLLSLALTIAALWCRATMLFEGIALAITPMVIFLAGVVNPSGFEIAAAICAWTAGLALVRNGALRPARAVLISFIVSGCALELTRGLSVLWMGLILVTLFCLEPRSCAQLLRRWPVRIGCTILAIVGALAVTFVLSAQTLEVLHSTEYGPFHGSFVVLTEHVLGLFGGYAHQIIGVFGWLDTPSPLLVTFLWTSLVGFLLILGISASRRRDGWVLIGVIAGAVIVTVAVIEWNAGSAGITWQARDGLPLYVGVPLVAGVAIPKQSILGFGDAVRWRIAAVLAIAVGASQLVDFVWTLRRYTVGLGKTVNLFQPVLHGWSPPPGTRLMVALGAVAIVLYATLLFNRMRS